MNDEDALKEIQKELKAANIKKAADDSQVMQIIHSDGSITEVENPFGPMLATYAELAADPAAMPELSDESRERILTELETKQVAVPIAPDPIQEAEDKRDEKAASQFMPNRHDRRRAAALAKRAKKGGRK